MLNHELIERLCKLPPDAEIEVLDAAGEPLDIAGVTAEPEQHMLTDGSSYPIHRIITES